MEKAEQPPKARTEKPDAAANEAKASKPPIIAIGKEGVTPDEEQFYTNLLTMDTLLNELLGKLRTFGDYDYKRGRDDKWSNRSAMQSMVLFVFVHRSSRVLTETGSSLIPFLKKTNIMDWMYNYLNVEVHHSSSLYEEVIHGILGGIFACTNSIEEDLWREFSAPRTETRTVRAPQGPRQRNKSPIVIKPLPDSVPVTEEEKGQHKDKPAPSTACASP
jgi:hypothetical protein